MQASIIKHSVLIAGHHTSVSLEAEFWDIFKQIAKTKKTSVNSLITQIDKNRSGNLSSAIRIYILQELLEHISELENTIQ